MKGPETGFSFFCRNDFFLLKTKRKQKVSNCNQTEETFPHQARDVTELQVPSGSEALRFLLADSADSIGSGCECLTLAPPLTFQTSECQSSCFPSCSAVCVRGSADGADSLWGTTGDVPLCEINHLAAARPTPWPRLSNMARSVSSTSQRRRKTAVKVCESCSCRAW